MNHVRLWPVLLFCTAILAHGSRPPRAPSIIVRDRLEAREHFRFHAVLHDSTFAPVSRGASDNGCESTRPPEAIATPIPLRAAAAEEKVIVTFIVGMDGRVHSPLI